MVARMRALLVFVGLGFLACNGALLRIRVDETATTTIPRGTVVEALLGSFGFDEFTAINLLSSEELRNQGVQPGDIVDTRVVQFDLVALEPDGSDLSFLESLDVYVEAPGLDRVRIASSSDFPEGESLVALEVEDVDLAPYVVSESMTVSTEARGSRPDEDTTVEARFGLSVGVTSQGACNAIRGEGGG